MIDNSKTLLAALTVYRGSINLVTACNDAFTELSGLTSSVIRNSNLADKLILDKNDHNGNLDTLFDDAMHSEEGIVTNAKIFNQFHYTVGAKLHCVYEGCDIFSLYFSASENKSVDPITRLPNGWALISRINYLLENSRIALKNMVLLILEADNFSAINFRYDYVVGDQFLSLLGQRLQSLVKSFGFVIRFSNAKYAILIEDHENLPELILKRRIELICQNLCFELAKPIVISDELAINKSFSIGVSAPGYEYHSYHAMQIAAETVKQKAKKYSINNYFIATPEPTEDYLRHKLIIEALPKAMSRGVIDIHYQPQYDMKTQTLVGLEALSRWTDQSLGVIRPDIFISIIEEIGLHFEFDLWVFEKVCKQLTLWQRQNIHAPRVAINVSFKTMEMSTFIERIKQILVATGCPTHFLELEVTETASINNTKMLSDNMLQVKALGMHIAVDDFGTGYSSLSLIRTFHNSIDKLKLDRSLVDKVCHTELDKNFIKHIIELGRILDVRVLAEGVETVQQLELLVELNCDYAQGYYFSKALPLTEVIDLIKHDAEVV
ncbi:putative bifunctional diguanylate cyclase/phosphodiesterase [Psychromonas sp. GE-S-Ul-11]|uniref:putative bifunctional diguanylate cyclase/phosphodiesterase n=1 Tax=Psychromonas sp. GE-S-Ul-11 TaxID=3241170 RepID=UPI00390CA9AE